MDYQVVIETFTDLDFLAGALASVPDSVPVHVIDGRYATFDGEMDWTPGARRLCERFPNTTLHRDRDRLPWGHERDAADPAVRWPQVAQMRFVLGAIPNDTWTLKLDADERLRRLDVAESALDESQVYHATVHVDGHPYPTMPDGELYVPRLWYPERWTFWTDDVPLPRDEYPRDTPAEELYTAKTRGEHLPHQNVFLKDDIQIDNVGHERPAAWHERRDEQLRVMYHG